FILSTVLVSAVVILLLPHLLDRYADFAGPGFSLAAGLAGLAFVALYVFGSWLHLKPLKIGSFQLQYPRLRIVLRQLVIGPVELLAAASIVYFALPSLGNPGYLAVLGIFLI